MFQFLLMMCFARSLPGSHCVSLHGVFRHMGLNVTSCSLYIIGGHSCVFKMNHSLTSYESLTDLLWITHPPAKVNLSNTRRRCCITRGLIVSLTVNSHRELMILLIVFGHYCFCILTVPWLRCCWRLFVLTQGGIFVMVTDCFLHREGNICISYNCGQR